MNNLIELILKLGKVDRRWIFLIIGIVVTVATFETAKRRPSSFSFVKGYHTPSRNRGAVWINGKKTTLPEGDPGGEHE